MWNLEQTERFVVRTRPIIVFVALIMLVLMTLNLNPLRLSRDLANPQSVTIQHTLN